MAFGVQVVVILWVVSIVGEWWRGCSVVVVVVIEVVVVAVVEGV